MVKHNNCKHLQDAVINLHMLGQNSLLECCLLQDSVCYSLMMGVWVCTKLPVSLTINVSLSEILLFVETGGSVKTCLGSGAATVAVAVCIDQALLLGTTRLADSSTINCDTSNTQQAIKLLGITLLMVINDLLHE